MLPEIPCWQQQQLCNSLVKFTQVNGLAATIVSNHDGSVSIEFKAGVLQVKPAFAGSMLSQMVHARIQLDAGAALNGRHEEELRVQANAADLYAMHHCLPSPQADAIYEKQQPILMMLGDFPVCWNSTIDSEQLVDRLHHFIQLDSQISPPTPLPLTLMHVPADGAGNAPEFLPKNLSLNTIHLSERTYRRALIAKADLVLSHCTGIAVDTIILHRPFAFVQRTNDQFLPLEDCIQRFFLHQDKQRLLDEQRQVLIALAQPECQDTIALDSHEALHELVFRLCNSNTTDVNHRVETTRSKPFFVETELAHLPDQLTTRARLSRLQINGQRKWQKFRESPRRFFIDSQHCLLKPIKVLLR